MLVRKRKEKNVKKRGREKEIDSEENLQSVRSWIRKIEQTTSSVSSRLAAVEKRLSGRTSETDSLKTIDLQGPVETLLVHGKKKNTAEIARVLDAELSCLHNEQLRQQQEFNDLKEQLNEIEKTQTTVSTALQTMQISIADLHTLVESQRAKKEKHEPLVMHLGSLEVPVEFTGIIGGLLVFLIAILVLIGQKEILLSPWFLFPVGLLLIGFALVKMIRNRTRSSRHSFFPLPLETSTVQPKVASIKRKEG
jgi:prefoldin subunit 5